MLVLAAVCEGLTWYVPVPPVPVPSAVMAVVPDVSVPPAITIPSANVPEVAAVTVRRLPAMLPVAVRVPVVVPTIRVATATDWDGLTVYVGPTPAVTSVPAVKP
jgi:hypothetical protein